MDALRRLRASGCSGRRGRFRTASKTANRLVSVPLTILQGNPAPTRDVGGFHRPTSTNAVQNVIGLKHVRHELSVITGNTELPYTNDTDHTGSGKPCGESRTTSELIPVILQQHFCDFSSLYHRQPRRAPIQVDGCSRSRNRVRTFKSLVNIC